MKDRRLLARRALRVLQVLVTLSLLTLLLRSADWENASGLWEQMDAGFLAACVSLIIASNVIGAMALLVLIELKGRWRWWLRFTVDYFHVQALCQITPAQAGEIALPYIAARDRFAPGEIAASLLIQRFTSLGIIALAAVVGAGRWAPQSALWGAAGVALLSCVAVIALIGNSAARRWMNDKVARRFGPVLYGFYDTLTSVFRSRKQRLFMHFLLMIVRFLVGVAASYAVLMAFGVSVPFWDVAALSAVATIAALVPVSINGFGVTEGIFVAALAGYGYGTEQVLAACLAGRALGILTLVVFSVAFSLRRTR